MLNVRYDPESRSGFVRLREGRTARTRQLSPQATADEDALLAVIRAQTGKAVWTTPQDGPEQPKQTAAKSGAGSGEARRRRR